jgi:predicted nucleotidyltransferase
MIMPILGTRIRSLADALFSRTQQRVLGLLFGHPDRNFHTAEIIRRARSGSGSTQRELARLEESGLVIATRVGRQKHYQANLASPLFQEVESIISKTVGLAEPLKKALAPLAKHISGAFVFGSVAAGRDRSASDIDLMVIGKDLSYGDVFGALERTSRTLMRPINPTVYSPKEFDQRLRGDSAFVGKVWERPKIWIIGSEDEFRP